MPTIETELRKLHNRHFGTNIKQIEALPASGSYRQYFRITDDKQTVLGVYNTDLQENKAYLSFSKSFLRTSIRVPEIYITSNDQRAYLVQDIGKESLWDIVKEDLRIKGQLSDRSLNLYKKTIKGLIKIQTQNLKNLNFRYCYPRDAFDKQSMLWDFYYYKYMFLRVTRVPFDEQKLEIDFQNLASELDKVDRQFFLFRDFQSRNVMIKDDEPYFIDFQGGRKGAIFYDIASIVYDANVELNKTDRLQLINYYYEQWNLYQITERKEFECLFYKFALVRLMQALGAFGLRGVIEKKPHFVECIPYALSAVNDILKNEINNGNYPEIEKTIKQANNSDYILSLIKS